MDTGPIVYCSFCGATPGTGSTCPAKSSEKHHSFKESRKPVYCSFCGATPGRPSTCPAKSREAHHTFREVSG